MKVTSSCTLPCAWQCLLPGFIYLGACRLPVGHPATALQWFIRGERGRTCVSSGTIAFVHLTLVAVVLSAEMLDGCPTALPPVLEIGGDYEDWRTSVYTWRDVTDVPQNQQALEIFLRLRGEAKDALLGLTLSEINRDDGVIILLEKLDKFFRGTKTLQRFSAIEKLFKFYRKEGCPLSRFTEEFDRMYQEVVRQGVEVGDTVIAYLLLSLCQLSVADVQSVLSSIATITYDTMKRAIIDILPDSNVQEVIDRGSKSEHVDVVQEFSREVVAPFNINKNENWQTRGTARCKLNKRNSKGRVSRCFICRSKFHLSRTCPYKLRKQSFNGEHTAALKVNSGEENLNISMFLGYSNGATKSQKLNMLVKDSSGHALLDSGCSKTVCGLNWFEDYIGTLSYYDRSCIVESESDASFTFGDGANVSSLKKVVLPCYIHERRCEIEADVVECNVPLLMSKTAMKKGKMSIDFENDTAIIGGKRLKLNLSSAGHYLMPLSL